ncbi:dihydroorotate dehydrogenase-like protein [Thermophagus xiamenensis]|jgi:dihydroorotate dehydrogenase (fumarate)|uniref:Dihydroorotate dehydrogenase (Fumarate) n=1 Tax=Thermophagus xiamenensis TaxID=385682 RepID=A0A1I1VB73_9BACT|nr:dihydroorotate dehydrogenase-like protein [Thermophagus xiamenensis]SFD80227.1 dihydroorotate dehydrogenase (fumarate) [Thermophagus xiamenensis]
MDLSTHYMGIPLKNPLMVGASNLVTNLETVKKIESAGASAIVFKTLFEEQINLEAAELEDELHEYDERHAEMVNLFPNVQHAGPRAHLLALKELKETVSIPVIASLNCIFDSTWVEYAEALAKTGVDGLELNFYNTITDANKTPLEIESTRINILKKIKRVVDIPVAIKLSPFYTNVLEFINRLSEDGADAFVLFNRLFQPDINIWKESFEMPYNLSHKGDNRLSIRYAGLLHGHLQANIAANTGILDGDDLIAVLLAGADAAQVVSTIYRNGVDQISKMLDELTEWMKEKGYKSIDDFKGKMSHSRINEPYAYKRGQYVDFLMKSNEYAKKYPLP